MEARSNVQVAEPQHDQRWQRPAGPQPQALAGPALKGGELMDISPSSELAALGKLTANWRSVVEDAAITPIEREVRRTGQQILGFEES